MGYGAAVAVAVDGISSLGHSGIVTLNGLNGLNGFSGVSGVSGVVGSLAYAAFHASCLFLRPSRRAIGEPTLRGFRPGVADACQSRGVPP